MPPFPPRSRENSGSGFGKGAAAEKDLKKVEWTAEQQNAFAIHYEDGAKSVAAAPAGQNKPLNQAAVRKHESGPAVFLAFRNFLSRQVELKTEEYRL